MKKIVSSPRNGCAFHGALRTACEIGGVVPIVHSNAGCAMQSYESWRGGRFGGYDVPSTNVIEKQIIFGGGSRLREQIKNTVKVLDGRLYVVLNGCESAMVGDDLLGMTKEAVERGEPVVSCQVVGFHGDTFYGYSRALWEIIAGASEVRRRSENECGSALRRVNIFGLVPGLDVNFRGDLLEIRRIFSSLGLDVNIFFGPGDGVREIFEASSASLSLTFSKWGRFVSEKMEERFGIPYLSFDSIPIGYNALCEVVLAVAERLSLDAGAVASFLRGEERHFEFFMNVARESVLSVAGTSVAIAGSESLAAGVSPFLIDCLAAKVGAMIFTDVSQSDRKRFDGVFFSQDALEIREILSKLEIGIILGSAIETEAARELGIPSLEISFPQREAEALSKTYFGAAGGVRLVEDYLSKLTCGKSLEERETSRKIRDAGTR